MINHNQSSQILIVDDTPQNIQVLGKILEDAGYQITIAQDGAKALNTIEKIIPNLILMDIMMPNLDGFEACKRLKENPKTNDIPIIFLTAKIESDDIIKGFDLGAADYVTKPFNPKELLARVSTHLKLQKQKELLMNNELHLLKLVEEKTNKIEKATLALVQALENANLANDDDTGNHIKRVSHYTAVVAEAYGCDHDFVKKIKLYSSLHDVGKVGISDAILKKAGKLTPEEFDQMKQHVAIGYNMLNNIELDDMPKNIALYHHERWDGSGYVNQLKGEQIPLEARITSVADVYDALISKRSYKKAFSQKEAEDIIKNESNRLFDPGFVELFFDKIGDIIEIKETYK